MVDSCLLFLSFFFFFFFNDTATTEIYTLSLHDALPISRKQRLPRPFHLSNRVEGSQEIAFAHFHAAMAENRVGGRGVKIEIRHRLMEKIGLSLEVMGLARDGNGD